MGLFSFLFGGAGSYKKSLQAMTQQNIVRDWQNIDILISQKSPAAIRDALSKADRSLDNALRDLVSGETMGERLKNSQDMFDRYLYNKIWEAHKLRNALAHEAGFEPTHFVVSEAIENLRTALQVLGLRV